MHRNTKNLWQVVLLTAVTVSITGNALVLPVYAAEMAEPKSKKCHSTRV
ncbi:hypothetical protein [Lacrimispora xylanisolvens]